ncbi:MAG: hypothetical protein ABWY18_05335 [Tardiphaga sp.]
MAKGAKPKSKDKASKDKRAKDMRAKDKTRKLKGANTAAAPEPETGDDPSDEPAPTTAVRKRPRSVKPPSRRATAAKSIKRPAPRRRRAPPAGDDVTPLADRVVSAIEDELDMIETIVGRPNAGPGQRTDAERRARTLASLARTLSELKKLQSVDLPMKAADDTLAAGDDEAFRLDLARRLGITVAEAKTVHPDEEPPL